MNGKIETLAQIMKNKDETWKRKRAELFPVEVINNYLESIKPNPEIIFKGIKMETNYEKSLKEDIIKYITSFNTFPSTIVLDKIKKKKLKFNYIKYREQRIKYSNHKLFLLNHL